MRILLVIFLMIGSFSSAMASNLCQVRASSLQFILSHQVKENGSVFKRGEWPSVVNLGGWASYIGATKQGFFEDRNLFTTVSVHNILAEIYLKYSRDPRLLASMNMAMNVIPEYQTSSGAYNFWPKVQGSIKDLHLPHFRLTSSSMEGTLAIPADADDTALTQYAFYLRSKICRINSPVGGSECVTPDQNVERYYTPYTDRGRFPAPSNLSRGELGTGAYLTWFAKESWIPNLFFALSSHANGPRVVLDKNDVDCVVNANVLRTLTAYQKTNVYGYADACRLLKSNAKDKDYSMCGHYYPDTYWFHYSVARAYQDGASCLQEPALIALNHLLKQQKANGSWHNEMFNNDEILATAFALGALVKVGNPQDSRQVEVVRKGLNYLLAQRKVDPYGQTYWNGGIFFSAGLPVRHHVQWYSHSFTTAIVTMLLYDVNGWLPEAKSCAM